MSKLKNIHLVLFFTQGVSLKIWEETGMFDREVAFYKALRPHLRNISFVTYGDADELSYTKRLDGIRISCSLVAVRIGDIA